MTGKVNPTAARRAAARLAAVQALYQMEMTGTSADEALKDDADRRAAEPRGRIAEPDAPLLGAVVRGTTQEAPLLDEIVGNALSADWPVERLEAVIRAILRAGAWELKARAQTPARVVISQYVDVAHAFYSGPEPGMVNAVLDKVARVFRPGEFEG